MLKKLKQGWRLLRELSGDDAYERYLENFSAHCLEHHVGDAEQPEPLTREAFFKEWQSEKWKGVKRCC